MPPFEESPVVNENPTLLSRIENHPYFAVALIASIVAAIGIIVVLQRLGVSSSETGTAWVSGSGIFRGASENAPRPRANPFDLTRQQSPQTELPHIPLPVPTAPVEGEFSGELSDLLLLLSPKATTTATSNAPDVGNAYSFIPQGLISISSNVKKRTPSEEALHTYGNDVGTYIQSFEESNANTAQVLKDHAEDRTNVDKQKALSRLGLEYAQLGLDLSEIQPVPEVIKSAHTSFAAAYQLVGTNLKKIAETTTDEAYLEAIGIYNESADGMTKRFIALTTLFGGNNVTFTSSEPGSVFMFTANTAL